MLLQSWRVLDRDDVSTCVTIEEHPDPDTVVVGFHSGGEVHNVFLSKEAFRELAELQYRIHYAKKPLAEGNPLTLRSVSPMWNSE